jgi:hypothetical protein
MKLCSRFHCFLFATALIGTVAGCPSAGLADSAVDNRIYAELLQEHVRAGQVDYKGFKAQEAKLDRFLAALARLDVDTLSRDEQFAVYVNAYNGWTIKLILQKYPKIESIRELGIFNSGPWKQKIVPLNGQALSLDHIEHAILRPRFKDPRVHFAINCAAKSCPPLRAEPFQGDRLDQQIEEATRSFLNNSKSHRLDGDIFYVSKIFDWFGQDFNHDILGFYLQYAEGDLKNQLEARQDSLKIDFLDYDWGLNGA